jgi:hypothetical protein
MADRLSGLGAKRGGGDGGTKMVTKNFCSHVCVIHPNFHPLRHFVTFLASQCQNKLVK